jgi:hypothetical protein
MHSVAAAAIASATLVACLSLRIFSPAVSAAKLSGVDPRYPWFVRAAFLWLVAAALLQFGAALPGVTGASRHAFTVGFLATLVLSIGPRILPAFLNSRELWSTRLMLAAMVALTIGCALRVVFEPLAYDAGAAFAWGVLPVSAAVELAAMLLFAVNIGVTLLSPMPAWIAPHVVTSNLSVYWLVAAYPDTRAILAEAGLPLAPDVLSIPRDLTLGQAAEAAGRNPAPILERLRAYFGSRQPRALRR